MSHFAILTLADAGHVLPLGSIGRELVRRGHRVTVIARGRAERQARELGLEFRTLEMDRIPWPFDPLWLAFLLVGNAGLINFRNAVAQNARGVLELVPPLLKELRIDGLVLDHVLPAGGTAAERAGVPFITVCSSPPWIEDPALPPPFTSLAYEDTPAARRRYAKEYRGWRWFMRPALRCINRFRRRWGMRSYDHIDECYSRLAQISQLFTEFDYPRTVMPEWFHYVGALAADREYSSDGFPWKQLDGRPIIYASLGTMSATTNRPVYPRIAAACEGLDAQLVIGWGKWNENDDGQKVLDGLPGNPLVVDYAPQLALLDRAALSITHAGLNSTLEAISRAVPMVALPRHVDQPGNAARIAYSGVGLCGSFFRDTPGQLRRLIERVLGDDSFRRRGKELQAAMRRAGGAARAAEIAEQALTTGRPVLRDEVGAASKISSPASV